MGVYEAVVILTLGLASVLSLTIKFLPAGRSFMHGSLEEPTTDSRDFSYSRLQFVTYRGQFSDTYQQQCYLQANSRTRALHSKQ